MVRIRFDLFQMIPRQRIFCLLLQAELCSKPKGTGKKASAGRIIWKFAPPLTGWPKAICFRFMMYESFCPSCRLSLLKAERNRIKSLPQEGSFEVCAPTYRMAEGNLLRFMMYESFCPYCRLSLLKAERNRQKKPPQEGSFGSLRPTYRIHLQQRNNTLPTSRAHSELNGI